MNHKREWTAPKLKNLESTSTLGSGGPMAMTTYPTNEGTPMNPTSKVVFDSEVVNGTSYSGPGNVPGAS